MARVHTARVHTRRLFFWDVSIRNSLRSNNHIWRDGKYHIIQGCFVGGRVRAAVEANARRQRKVTAKGSLRCQGPLHISFIRIKHRKRANDILIITSYVYPQKPYLPGIIRACLMYHAACKVEFQPFTRSYSQLTFFNFLFLYRLYILVYIYISDQSRTPCKTGVDDRLRILVG